MNIFEMLHEKYCLPPKPKLFEAFSGIGCQRMAFNRLGIDYEMVGVSEIDKYALQSYMAIHGETKNYGSITDIQSLPEVDVFTWSFPCTDLSKAGKQKGLTNTRSGLVYEVLRILHNTELKPKVLIMENVVDLVQTKFINEFNEIQLELEQMGYTNYVETLNAKNYGVAQNRDRVFMVSILGQYYYEFPKPIPLEKRLKDYLEDDVDEKYYLSDKLLNFFIENSKNNEEKGNGFRFRPKEDDSVANTITTLAGNRMDDNFIKIPEDTQKGYSKAYVGDGVYINRPHQKRGVVQKEMIQTLKTSGADVGVVVKNKNYTEYSMKKIIDNICDLDGNSKTITANPQRPTIDSATLVKRNLRIRKLTPLECWRLMGIDDECFHKADKVCSNSQLYKQAGNGIVVDVFAAILKTMIKED